MYKENGEMKIWMKKMHEEYRKNKQIEKIEIGK